MITQEKIASILNSRRESIQNRLVSIRLNAETKFSLDSKLELYQMELRSDVFIMEFEDSGMRGVIGRLSKVLNNYSLRLNSSSSVFENFRNQEKATEIGEVLNAFVEIKWD